ncbi:MAG: GNAT family N-acetyltransferase [Nanoarchaeota archaeon]|nr:GNAT family N-acetyltransferase [Nanoarchaeota archaeon]
MDIRKARSKDINGIYQCFLDMAESEDRSSKKIAGFLMSVRKRKKNFETSAKKELLREIKEKNSIYLVAEENQEIAGYIYGSIKITKSPFFDLPKVGHFNALVVRKKFRGYGISKLLNQELEKWLKKQGCKMVYLEVFSENPASELYLKWGYKKANYIMAKKL